MTATVLTSAATPPVGHRVVILSNSSRSGSSLRQRRRSLRETSTLFVWPDSGLLMRGGCEVVLPNGPRRRLLILAVRCGAPVGRGELIDLMFGDRADGGPDDCRSLIGSYVFTARGAAAALGLRIEAHYGHGYALRAHRPGTRAVAA